MRLFRRCLLAFLLTFSVPLVAASSDGNDWLYEGSDLPKDPAWQIGTLPNGVRYAIRRNALPAGQVSIRVRIGVGSLNEEDGERGWAHLIEHLAFRGTESFDARQTTESWQQMGAQLGADANASTGPSQTVYQLDLPRNDRGSIDKSLAIFAEMMDSARLEPAAVDSERRIVLAEKSRRTQLADRIAEVAQPHFYAGLKFGRSNTIGTEATLAAATPDKLRAFYERWYRPDLATVIIVGDADPAMLEELLVSRFGGWKGTGPEPRDLDYGTLAQSKDNAATLAYPGAPYEAQLIWHRPLGQRRPGTIALRRAEIIRTTAMQIVQRRLDARARENAPYLSARLSISQTDFTGDTTSLTVTARDGRWSEALQDVFAILADALRAPPSASEIERELSNWRATTQAGARMEGTIPSPILAMIMIPSADSGVVPTAAAVTLELNARFAREITPAQVADATKLILSGAGPRIMLLSPDPVKGGTSAVAAALASAQKAGPARRPEVRIVTFDSLPKLGTPGQERSRQTIDDMGVTIVRFANGSSLTFKHSDFTKGFVDVYLRIGTGLATLPSQQQPPPAWMAPAFTQSGFGDFNFGDLQNLTTGRQISFNAVASEDGFALAGTTSPEDLGDQLRFYALKLAFPRWDEVEFGRAKASGLQGYEQRNFGSAAARAGRETAAVLHPGDQRWTPWAKEKVASVTPAELRRSFEALMSTGPLELIIVGDVGLDQAVAAAAATIGALPARPDRGAVHPIAAPRPDPKPQVFTHTGDPGQAAVLIGWSTPGRTLSFRERRTLALAGVILGGRLTGRLRADQGVTYAVNAGMDVLDFTPGWGIFRAQAQVKPESVDSFFRIAREEVTYLSQRAVSADEFTRAQNGSIAGLERDMKTNRYWAINLRDWTNRPDLIELHRDRIARLKSITAEDVRAAVAAFVADEGDWSMTVLPEKTQTAGK